MPGAAPTKLKLRTILEDDSIQVRSRLDDETVERYREVIDSLPPVLVYEIDGKCYLADGFHRVSAFRREHRDEILAIVRRGSREDAQEAAISENTRHGRPLSRVEREQAIRRLLQGRRRTQEQIAALVGVSQQTVHSIQRAVDVEKRTKVPNIRSDNPPRTRHYTAISRAPKEFAQPLVDATAKHGWTVEETELAAREVRDERTPPERKQAYLAGEVDVPLARDPEGRPTISAATITRQQRQRQQRDEPLAIQTLLHAIAHLRTFEQTAVVSALLEYEYRDTALADIDALVAWLGDVAEAVRAELRQPLRAISPRTGAVRHGAS